MQPNTDRPKRPRIPVKKLEPLPADPLAFEANKCSQRAKRVNTGKQDFLYELWIDQHYQVRSQHGDEFGRREGIEPEAVESLIKRAFVKLMLYSATAKGFTFINLAGKPPVRVILQEQKQGDDLKLNVVIEAHFLDVNKFEITVKTALRKDGYVPFAGEYTLELFEDGSMLRKYDNGKWSEIGSF
jgi:hypothetical protein